MSSVKSPPYILGVLTSVCALKQEMFSKVLKHLEIALSSSCFYDFHAVFGCQGDKCFLTVKRKCFERTSVALNIVDRMPQAKWEKWHVVKWNEKLYANNVEHLVLDIFVFCIVFVRLKGKWFKNLSDLSRLLSLFISEKECLPVSSVRNKGVRSHPLKKQQSLNV